MAHTQARTKVDTLFNSDLAMIPALYKKLTFAWLLMAMLWGLLLRGINWYPQLGIPYKFALHTHSHLALLGWVYLAFYLLLGERFFPASRVRSFKTLFWIKQLALVGMLVSFPFQGYAAASISFSTIFVWGSYLFAWWLYQETKSDPGPTAKLVKWSLAFLILSSIGPYCLGYFMAKDLGHLHWYNNAIYFYLHFLYNGFFFFGLFALYSIATKSTFKQREVVLFGVATVLSFFLSVLWIDPPVLVYGVAGAGALLQLWVAGKWCLRLDRQLDNRISGWRLIGLLIFAKYLIQALGAIPSVAAWAYQTQSFTIIAYIHGIMLGILTPALFFWLFREFQWTGWNRISTALYGIGFLWTEALLFGQGIWGMLALHLPYYPCLFVGYAMIILSLLGIGISLISYRE